MYNDVEVHYSHTRARTHTRMHTSSCLMWEWNAISHLKTSKSEYLSYSSGQRCTAHCASRECCLYVAPLQTPRRTGAAETTLWVSFGRYVRTFSASLTSGGGQCTSGGNKDTEGGRKEGCEVWEMTDRDRQSDVSGVWRKDRRNEKWGESERERDRMQWTCSQSLTFCCITAQSQSANAASLYPSFF